MRSLIISLINISSFIFVGASCRWQAEGDRGSPGVTAIDCSTVDQEIAELIVDSGTMESGIKLIDEAIEVCPENVWRHHQRALLAAARGELALERKHMDRAVELAERSGDQCLIDRIRIEREALRDRKRVSVIPKSCLGKNAR